MAALITPHGDRKRRPGVPSVVAVCPSTSSLPLMGIGNLSGGRRSASRPSRRAHYPSWGSETEIGAPVTAEMFFSLPLMGIGNFRPAAYCDTAGNATSLPLMGIGNSSCHASSPGHCRSAHYPSWGSETCAAGAVAGDVPPGDAALITPHGDRKRCRSDSGPHGPGSHYPSWGSETRSIWRRSAKRSRSHYPSWGSETRCARCAVRSGRCSHYPSWGSETSPGTVIHPAPADSLPLMGIGNIRSLPRVRSPRSTHYPSWGSETPACSSPSKPSTSHYPSWGSETCRRGRDARP